MSSLLQYYWDVFCLTFQGAWAITEVIAGVLAIIGGFIVWRRPGWESTMKNLLWMIPVGIFTLLLLIRLVIAPYTIYQNQQEVIAKLKNAQAQKELNTKQDIRTLFESISPEILRRIDAGQKKILTPIGTPNRIKLTNLSERPDFNKYLSLKQFTREDDFNDFEDPNIFIKGADYYYIWMQAHYLYPKDALRK